MSYVTEHRLNILYKHDNHYLMEYLDDFNKIFLCNISTNSIITSFDNLNGYELDKYKFSNFVTIDLYKFMKEYNKDYKIQKIYDGIYLYHEDNDICIRYSKNIYDYRHIKEQNIIKIYDNYNYVINEFNTSNIKIKEIILNDEEIILKFNYNDLLFNKQHELYNLSIVEDKVTLLLTIDKEYY